MSISDANGEKGRETELFEPRLKLDASIKVMTYPKTTMES
jgi:hypothetical protein